MLVYAAAIAMFIDHWNWIVGPWRSELYIAGRVAFPIFAVLLGAGLVWTSSLAAYAGRLWLCAIFSEPFHAWAMGWELPVNVAFNFAAVATAAWCLRRWYRWPLLPVLAGISYGSEYGIEGALLVAAAAAFVHGCRERNTIVVLATAGVALAAAPYIQPVNTLPWVLPAIAVSLLAVFGLAPALLTGRYAFGRHFFYWFYPSHLLAISMIATAAAYLPI